MIETKIFLIVMFFNHGASAPVQMVTEMDSWDQCLQAVNHAKLEVSQGAENEVSGLIYCAPSVADKKQFSIR